MPADERLRRMNAMRKQIRERDIFWWTETFLKAANDEELGADNDVEQWRPSAPQGFFSTAPTQLAEAG